MNLCKCGCGILVEKNYKRGHARRGTKNSLKHNLAISKANTGNIMPEHQKKILNEYHTGRVQSKEERLKRSIIAKEKGYGKWMIGKSPSKETRRKISISNTGNICSDETKEKIGKANTGNKNGMKHKVFTEEDKKIKSKAMKLVWNRPEHRIKIEEYFDSEQGKENCRRGALKTAEKLKSKKFSNTKPEREMKQILEELKLKYIHSYSVWNIKHKYPADFYLPDFNMVIEVDGKYWHNYPNGTEKDNLRNKELKEKGYKILRFWENEFSLDIVKEAINNELQTV